MFYPRKKCYAWQLYCFVKLDEGTWMWITTLVQMCFLLKDASSFGMNGDKFVFFDQTTRNTTVSSVELLNKICLMVQFVLRRSFRLCATPDQVRYFVSQLQYWEQQRRQTTAIDQQMLNLHFHKEQISRAVYMSVSVSGVKQDKGKIRIKRTPAFPWVSSYPRTQMNCGQSFWPHLNLFLCLFMSFGQSEMGVVKFNRQD